MATTTEWVAAARPRTFSAAVVPVLVGAAVASATGHAHPVRLALALVVSLAVQIGTNYANDYSDGRRGTDAVRVGPTRLVGQRLASERSVLAAALAAFALAGAAGLVLALETSLYVLVVGAAAILAGWFYTGGPRPYGYAGYGEAFVFVFFGLVAVVGTVYVGSGRLPVLAFLAAVPVGLLTVDLLVANNLRDLEADRAVGKITLAVRIGAGATRRLYVAVIVLAYLFLVPIGMLRPAAPLALASAPLAVRPVRTVLGGGTGTVLIPVLSATGALSLCFGALLALGVAL